MSDLISRQDAIDAVSALASSMSVCLNKDECVGMKRMQDNVVRTLVSLPSAEPEIIHCRDCEYGEIDQDGWWFCTNFGGQVGESDGSGFCADAEKRR